MDEILYVAVNPCILTQKKTIAFRELGTFYCNNKTIVKTIEKETFYTLPNDCSPKTTFTISKVYERIHAIYPGLQMENVGEKEFIIIYEEKKKKNVATEVLKTVFVSMICFLGAAFTVMTFNEDVSVGRIFDKIYSFLMGVEKQGGSALEFCYAIGLPIGVLIFYNHFHRWKMKEDPTPIQVEMHTYEDQVNQTVIAMESREGKTIDVD